MLLGLAAGAGLLSALAAGSPPPVTVEGVAELLGRSAGVAVKPSDIVWEPQSSFFTEALWGRRVLFLGAASAGEPRDLFRGRVRLGYSGQPLSVNSVRNLTNTPMGDEAELVGTETHAAFGIIAEGAVQAVTVIDFAPNAAHSLGWLGRVKRGITNLQFTGSIGGLPRTHLLLKVPAPVLELVPSDRALHVELGTAERALDYEFASGTLSGPGGAQAYGARVQKQREADKPLVLWGVDTVRAVVGPELIAWLEDQVFGLRDLMKRTAFSLFSKNAELRELPAPQPSSSVAPQAPLLDDQGVLDVAGIGQNEGTWPPQSIPSLWKDVELHEGTWQAVELPFMRTSLAQGKAPPYLVQTFIRPDPKRPYSKLWLFAMDMRQLELGMQAGFEDPEPLTGPPGEGKLPDDLSVHARVIAAFNGAFKTEHGKYGMMVERRVLLPPMEGAATVWVDQFGEVGFGSFPKSYPTPKEWVFYRQNLDPLVEDGVANPTNRQLWGWQLEGKSVLTERTAICVSEDNHLYYAWGPELDGATLGLGLKQAGCSYALHLDMNPGHCGFVHMRIDDAKKRAWSLRHAVPQMSVPLERYVRWSPKDFFYVMLRDPVPSDPTGVKYEPDGGVQPPPTWWPGIWKGKLAIGGLKVELLSFEPGRVDYVLRAGTREPTELGAPLMKTTLLGADRHRVLGAIGLGVATRANRSGIAFDGQSSLPLRPKLGTLLLSKHGSPLQVLTGSVGELPAGSDAVQLPILAENAELTEEGRAHGPMKQRAALGVTPGGRLLVARAAHDSPAVVVTALVNAGCRTVLGLDRGSSETAFVHRAGTELPPVGDYEDTVIYVLSRPMLPHAKRWRPNGSTPSTKPTGYDVPGRRRTSAQ